MTSSLTLPTQSFLTAISYISKLSGKDYPWNLVNLEYKDEKLTLSCYSYIGYCRFVLTPEKSEGRTWNVNANLKELSDALNSFQKEEIVLEKEEKTITFHAGKKRRVSINTDRIHKFRIVVPTTESCTSVSFRDDPCLSRLNLMKLMGTKFQVDGIYLSEGKLLIINRTGTQIIYDSNCGISFDIENSEEKTEIMFPKSFIPILTDIRDIKELSIGSGRCIITTNNSELCIPMCAPERVLNFKEYITKVENLLENDSAITISPDPQLQQELEAAIKSTASQTVDPSIDMIITREKIRLRIENKFESEVRCSTEGFEAMENAEFGINVRSLGGALKELKSKREGSLKMFREGAKILLASFGTSHMILGMEKSSAGIRKVY